MHIFKNPEWIDQELLKCETLEEVPLHKITEIKERLASVVSNDPVVTVIIAAWNEEVNIIRCLDTLSRNKSSVPFDIIVINNNSKDRTQEVLDRLGVKSLFQPVQGCGPAREMGQRAAQGKYILTADADCLYPERWVETMTRSLMKEGVVFVYGRYSFLGSEKYSRWQFFLYDAVRDGMIEIRHIKRPYLNALGISMGYIKELGIKEGYITKNIRGDDGRLCFDIMKHGKVRAVRSNASRVWTSNRTLERDGSFYQAIKKRVLRELARFDNYLKPPVPHDTKVSQNSEYTVDESVSLIKKKYNPFRFLRKNK